MSICICVKLKSIYLHVHSVSILQSSSRPKRMERAPTLETGKTAPTEKRWHRRTTGDPKIGSEVGCDNIWRFHEVSIYGGTPKSSIYRWDSLLVNRPLWGTLFMETSTCHKWIWPRNRRLSARTRCWTSTKWSTTRALIGWSSRRIYLRRWGSGWCPMKNDS